MRVIRAEAMGMCFGVLDAIAVTESTPVPEDVTIYGELVHNRQVNDRLSKRGFSVQSEADRQLPATSSVMITAHGVSNTAKLRLQSAGKNIIDTTCPLVRRAHDRALQLDREGWYVVVAGKPGHVEVLGLTGDLSQYTVIEFSKEARLLPYPRIAIVCQTTLTAFRGCRYHSGRN